MLNDGDDAVDVEGVEGGRVLKEGGELGEGWWGKHEEEEGGGERGEKVVLLTVGLHAQK